MNITQTWFGRILCALGLHLLVTGQIDRANGYHSLFGGCVRCNKGFGWDL